jgi:hypothetical protein
MHTGALARRSYLGCWAETYILGCRRAENPGMPGNILFRRRRSGDQLLPSPFPTAPIWFQLSGTLIPAAGFWERVRRHRRTSTMLRGLVSGSRR